ncbi:diacylglycerol kinase family protein [Lacticaseibacillus hulanensis]|uniref:diacylglycerol kinase family protein n=1 Tax=Lacticaseibacillus hulanensis TaxID=2493111 RepID=UPI000FDA91DD|nr:diacylglycerol kinase family protein [Lacticaseibacillus hulanensis]
MASNGKNKNFGQALHHALAGLVSMVRTERNARFDLLAAAIAICLAYFLHVQWYRWVVLAVCIAAVLAAEAINTAIETLANAIAPDHQLQATGRAKDLAAGATLLICLGVLAAAIWLFGPGLLACF